MGAHIVDFVLIFGHNRNYSLTMMLVLQLLSLLWFVFASLIHHRRKRID
ncbi:MAG: hypothetical protein GY850_18215 [bacterium]|nr:hypothetical protein [bacterium]